MSVMAPGGGYMVASVHTIMDEVPPENILAMVDAVEEFGKYPIVK
jgi:uroporphyrinogen decarboxylase